MAWTARKHYRRPSGSKIGILVPGIEGQVHVPTVRTRPRRRELPGEHIVHAHLCEPRHTEGHDRRHGLPSDDVAHGAFPEPESLAYGSPCSASRSNEPERRAHVRLLGRGEVAHALTVCGSQNFGSMPN